LDLLFLNPGYNKLKNRNENLATAGGNRTLTLIYIGYSSSFLSGITLKNMFQIHVLYRDPRSQLDLCCIDVLSHAIIVATSLDRVSNLRIIWWWTQFCLYTVLTQKAFDLGLFKCHLMYGAISCYFTKQDMFNLIKCLVKVPGQSTIHRKGLFCLS